MPYPTLTDNLPRDSSGKAFVGPQGRIPRGLPNPLNDNEATPYTILVGPDGVTPLVGTAGLLIQGSAAHDAASIGNPVKMGGKASTSVPAAVANGDAVEAFFDLLGQLGVVLRGPAGGRIFPDVTNGADGVSNTVAWSQIATFLHAFNGTTWDRLRSSITNGLVVDVSRQAKTPLTAAAPTQALISTASAQAVAVNSNRKGLVIQNLSANIVSLGVGATAEIFKGITLDPKMYWVMDEYTFSTQVINAIASAGTGNVVSVQEFN